MVKNSGLPPIRRDRSGAGRAGSTNYQPNAVRGKRCHKLNTVHYGFSPEVKEWLDRCHALRALLRLKTGKKVRNKGNVKRFAQRCGIANPEGHSAAELALIYKECKPRQRS